MNDRLLTALPDLSLAAGLISVWLIRSLVPWPHLTGYGAWVIGGVVVLAGSFLGFSVLSDLRKRGTSTNAGDDPELLVTTGPYGYSRNPYYLACAVILLGAAVISGSVAALLAPAVYVAVLNGLVMPAEERKLSKRFGQKYDDYKGKARRWL